MTNVYKIIRAWYDDTVEGRGLIDRARAYALEAHAGQDYGAGRPYAAHLEATAEAAARHGLPPEAAAACWLHDVIEDTPTTEAILRLSFPPEVVDLVAAVTDAPGRDRRERAARTWPKIRERPLAVAVKLCDRVANAGDAKSAHPGLFGMYAREHAAFSAALRRPGEWDGLWAELDALFS